MGDSQFEPREEPAKRHGFDTYADLFAASTSLPMTSGDTARSYVAQQPNGDWFMWNEIPRSATPDRNC